MPETTPQDNAEKPDREGKTLSIRPNKDGYYEIPLNVLKNLKILLPRGFEHLAVNLCYVYPPTGMPEVGLTKDRPTLMPTDDLEKLFQVRGILAGTEKIADREGEKAHIDQMIYNAGNTLPAINVGANLKPETLRIYSLVDNLLSSQSVIERNRATSARNGATRAFLIDQIRRLQTVLTAQLRDTLDVTREKADLRFRLLQAGTCTYLWNKLVNNRVTLPIDSALELILFPMKTDSGLGLTTEELREPIVLNVFQAYMAKSMLFADLVRSPEFLARVACASPLDDEKEILRANRFMWRLIPTIPRAEAIVNRRISHQTESGRDKVMQNINEFFLDLFLGICPLGMDVVRFWAYTVSVAVNPNTPIPLNQQAATLITADEARDLFPPAKGNPMRTLLQAFGAVNSIIINLIADTPVTGVAAPNIVADDGLLAHMADPQVDTVRGWLATRPQLTELTGKQKKTRKNLILYLSTEAKNLLMEIQEDEDHPLHSSIKLIKSFLGSFQEDAYQRIAVRMFASYEEEEDEEVI